MTDTDEQYPDVQTLLATQSPRNPVYCIYPHVYLDTAKEFLAGFPGRVMFAVKSNPHPTVLSLLADAGIRHFDCASLPEIELVDSVVSNAKKYFMTPVRIRGAAKTAQDKHGVRHFLVDHPDGLSQLLTEIDPDRSVVFARMAVHHESAFEDLSARFGAPPEQMADLLQAIRESGAEPALAFNVGSSVTDPEAYRHAMSVTRSVLEELPFRLRLIDVGGGYPKSYPDFVVPRLDLYFQAVAESAATLPLADGAEILGEPGRALAAPGMSAVVEILLRKDDHLFINDGMFGIFWLLRIDGPDSFPVRAFRNGEPLDGEAAAFKISGPTCDSTDTLPGLVPLPANIRSGDYLEFGNIGAYSIGGRTDYNGFYSNRVVTITSSSEKPPLVADLSA